MNFEDWAVYFRFIYELLYPALLGSMAYQIIFDGKFPGVNQVDVSAPDWKWWTMLAIVAIGVVVFRWKCLYARGSR